MVSSLDLGGYEPYNQAHAIVSCVISIQFSRAVALTHWPAIRRGAYAAARELELGAAQAYYNFSLTFDGARTIVALGGPSPISQEVQGITFGRVDDEDRPIERIVVARDGLIFANHAYVRWEPFFARVKTYLGIIFPTYVEVTPCIGVKLEYFDRFDVSSIELPDVSKVIDTQSDYISRRSLSQTDPWHSYSGYFERLSASLRRLVNVRVDAGDFPSARDGQLRRSIIIYTMLNDTVNAPGYDFQPAGMDLTSVIASAENQHTDIKHLLAKVLSPAATDRIELMS